MRIARTADAWQHALSSCRADLRAWAADSVGRRCGAGAALWHSLTDRVVVQPAVLCERPRRRVQRELEEGAFGHHERLRAVILLLEGRLAAEKLDAFGHLILDLVGRFGGPSAARTAVRGPLLRLDRPEVCDEVDPRRRLQRQDAVLQRRIGLLLLALATAAPGRVQIHRLRRARIRPRFQRTQRRQQPRRASEHGSERQPRRCAASGSRAVVRVRRAI
eukprot:961063-Prymnesium_polylepis.1